MLLVSAHIQEKDADFLNQRKLRREKLLGKDAGIRDITPIYNVDDATQVLPQFQRAPMHLLVNVVPG